MPYSPPPCERDVKEFPGPEKKFFSAIRGGTETSRVCRRESQNSEGAKGEVGVQLGCGEDRLGNFSQRLESRIRRLRQLRLAEIS